MRNSKFMPLFLTAVLVIILYSCQDLNDEDIMASESAINSEIVPWNDILTQLDTKSEIAFVQNGESIQEAINKAVSGDLIYIQPGNYEESLSNIKSDIDIIGISFAPNDLKISEAHKNKVDILKLYDRESIEQFKNKSVNKGKRKRFTDFSRTELGRGIAHYQFKVRMGPDEFDVIRIHRLIRESRAYHAVPTKGHVFMVHGAFTGFGGTFLTAGLESIDDINAANSSPFYLASKNIDVWGIDMGWTMVPNSTENFDFMQGWGYEKDASHTLRAMKIARLIRGISGQGFSALNILGFSSGNTVAYAAADRETQEKHRMKRHIKGIITLDNSFKVPDPDSGCFSAETVAADIAGGKYQNDLGFLFQTIGYLALNFPDADSPLPLPFASGNTNLQVFRIMFSLDPFGLGMHFFGGDFSIGTFYADETRAMRAVSNYNHFMPNLLWQEIDAVNCSSMDVSFDDHLSLIAVPIFYLGAGGGNGASGIYTGSQTSSSDVTNHIVSLDADPTKDFGHVDNVIGTDADQLAWSGLRDWISNHN